MTHFTNIILSYGKGQWGGRVEGVSSRLPMADAVKQVHSLLAGDSALLEQFDAFLPPGATVAEDTADPEDIQWESRFCVSVEGQNTM